MSVVTLSVLSYQRTRQYLTPSFTIDYTHPIVVIGEKIGDRGDGTEPVIFAGQNDWDPSMLYYTHRKGVMLWHLGKGLQTLRKDRFPTALEIVCGRADRRRCWVSGRIGRLLTDSDALRRYGGGQRFYRQSKRVQDRREKMAYFRLTLRHKPADNAAAFEVAALPWRLAMFQRFLLKRLFAAFIVLIVGSFCRHAGSRRGEEIRSSSGGSTTVRKAVNYRPRSSTTRTRTGSLFTSCAAVHIAGFNPTTTS